MSSFKNFAIVGAGNIGKVTAEELLRRKDAREISSVAILTRPARNHEDLEAKGAKIIPVDYSSPSSLNAALSDIDVAISCLPETFEQTEDHPLYRSRVQMRQTCKELELPYTLFWTGMFSDMMLGPGYSGFLGFNFAKGEFVIPGSGTAPISWTSSTDVARFIGHVLINLPREKLEWTIFRIEGDRIGLNNIAASWQKYSNKVVSISHRPRSEIEDEERKNPNDIGPPHRRES
ncbi:hypothetical protein ACEPAI_3150 [Sanghuangporus weigelae]